MDEERYMDIQNLEYQVKQLQQIIESIDSQLLDINNTKAFLEDFSKLKGNEEALFPLINGIFVSGRISQNKTLKINVGNNVVIEKSVEDVAGMLDKQVEEIETYKKEVMDQLDMFAKRLNSLERE